MKNWTIKEAVAVIQNGKDTEAIKELAKHFPMFFMAVARNDLGAVAAMMTDKMTVRRLQMEATEMDDEDESADTDAEAEDTADEGGEDDLDSMSTKQLIALCGKRGIKVPKYGKNKQFYLDALRGGSEDGADDDGEDEAEADPYAGKNAIQLYSICKKRGLKVEPRQKAAVYLKALKAADAKAAEAEDTESDDDDWGDEDTAEEQPKAKGGKSGGKGAKGGAKSGKGGKPSKPAKKDDAEDAGDDDDDWEI